MPVDAKGGLLDGDPNADSSMVRYEPAVSSSLSTHVWREIGGNPMAMGGKASARGKRNYNTIRDLCYIGCHTKSLLEL
jgi:hypothetical protein